MRWHLNELSLTGQFATATDFISAIEPLLKLVTLNAEARKRMRVSYGTVNRPVCQTMTLRQAVDSHGNRMIRESLLRWLTNTGKFWEDDRTENPDDYFEIYNQDVTVQGLGEASRVCISGVEGRAFSFCGSDWDFERSPLNVDHGIPEDRKAVIPVENLWAVPLLEAQVLAMQPMPIDWQTSVDQFKARCSGLVFSDDIESQLMPNPFSQGLASRIERLLLVLDKIVAETMDDGSITPRGTELIEQFFHGERALFTAESRQNIVDFERELTFVDPSNEGKRLLCHWHGKINTPKFRIHFEWPRPEGQKKIKIVYVGPKITKR